MQRVKPLALGTLGRWATLAPLPTARMGVQLVAVEAKAGDTRVALFAAGGFDSAPVSTVDRSIITVTRPSSCSPTARCARESHTLSAWATEAPLPGHPYAVRVATPTYGASMRMVVSPGRESDGVLHIPSGQSGHPMSPHYRDSHPAWLEGRPTPFRAGEAVGAIVLRP